MVVDLAKQLITLATGVLALTIVPRQGVGRFSVV